MEFITFLLSFATTISDPLLVNLNIARVCSLSLGYNKSDCALLGTGSKDKAEIHLEELTEHYASLLTMIRNILTTVLGGFSVLLVGPWSDRYGRKPVLIFIIVGSICSYILMVLFSVFESTSPWLTLIVTLPSSLTGGPFALITVVSSYVVDITSGNKRGFRLGLIDSTSNVGSLVANFTTSLLFNRLGYGLTFTVCLLSSVTALVYTIRYIPESNQARENYVPVNEIFIISHVRDLYEVIKKKRPKSGRLMIMCLMLLLIMTSTADNGSLSVVYLFFREKFFWSLNDFYIYNGVTSLVTIIGELFGIILLYHTLEIPESLLILTSIIFMLDSYLVLGLATTTLHIYTSIAFLGYSNILQPMVNSLLSKIVEKEDIGKIFSFTSVLTNTIFNPLANILYTAIYNLTLERDPGMFNFVSSGLYGFALLISGIVVYLKVIKRKRGYRDLREEDFLDAFDDI